MGYLSMSFKVCLGYTSILLAAGTGFTACTESILMQPMQPTGSVQIYPDMSVHTLPPTQYYFYRVSSENGEGYENAESTANDEAASSLPIIRDCDGYGNFIGTLPVGTYRVIATNVAASRVTFTDMDSHETAIVRLPELDSSLESPVSSRSTLHSPTPTFHYSLFTIHSHSRAAEDYTLLPQPGNALCPRGV